MKHLYLLLLSVITSAACAQSPVIHDNSFGTNGSVMFSIENNILNMGKDLLVLPDNKLICSAIYKSGSYYKLAVLKFEADGTSDTAFGTGGLTTFSLGNLSSVNNIINTIETDATGKIYVTGYGRGASAQDMFLCRLLPDGNPDSTFGTDGALFLNILPTATLIDACNAVALTGNGIFMAGATRSTTSTTGYNMALAKLTDNGNPDSTFTGNGRETYDITASQQDYSTGIVVQPDGKIVLGGYTGSSTDICFIRLNADGTVDNTFNTTGLTKIDILGLTKNDVTFKMAAQPDGKILISGNTINSANYAQPFVVRINADGSIDNTFGNGNGIAVFDFSAGSGAGSFNSMQVLANGKLLCIGQSINGAQKDILIARLLANGTLDSTFNYTGYLLYDASGLMIDDECFGVGLQSDGKIVTSGTVTLTPGTSSKCFISRVIPDVSVASFTQDLIEVCEGGSVHFDASEALNTTQWHWEFEGGNPTVSTEISPIVNYSIPGKFDVILITSNSASADTILVSEALTVLQSPPTPGVITGPISMCNQSQAIYSIDSVQGTSSYQWSLTPPASGTLVANGLTANFTPTPGYTGNYTIQVNCINSCGMGAPSSVGCQLTHPPQPFLLTGPGFYCGNSSGQTITLGSSQLNVQYELYFNGVSTGNILPGTANSLDWNNLTGIGFYTVKGSNGCLVSMAGQVYNELMNTPEQPQVPSGNIQLCNTETSTYSISEVSGASSYDWILSPATAGQLTENGIQANIIWDQVYAGNASLSVTASNTCGTGQQSQPLSIAIYMPPVTKITGQQNVCINHTTNYSALQQEGKQYIWEVTGGTILSGTGTNSIEVKWDGLGAGVVELTETSSNNCTNSDELLVMVSPCTGMESENISPVIKVYPNPVSDQLYIKGIENVIGNLFITITNVTGNKVIDYQCDATSLQSVKLPEITNGAYLFSIATDKGVVYRSTISVMK